MVRRDARSSFNSSVPLDSTVSRLTLFGECLYESGDGFKVRTKTERAQQEPGSRFVRSARLSSSGKRCKRGTLRKPCFFSSCVGALL